MRWLERYLTEGTPRLQDFAEVAADLASGDAETVEANFSTSNGTATAPDDYMAASGRIAFPPGETRKTVDIAVGDAAFEKDETFTITLSAPVAATIADGSATGTITNDDQPPAQAGAFSGQISSRDFCGHEFINFVVFTDGQTLAP